MDIYHDAEAGFEKPRLHPYIAIRPGEIGFVDFKREPDRISQVLEDFIPHKLEPAVQGFYRLLTWINGPESVLESCDCALRGPEAHEFEFSQHPLCVHGRLMLMYRDESANCDKRFDLLYETLANELDAVDRGFTKNEGAIGFSRSAALYEELCPVKPDKDGFRTITLMTPGRGYQLLLSFLAFGSDKDEALRNLDRVFQNLGAACQRASEILKSESRVP